MIPALRVGSPGTGTTIEEELTISSDTLSGWNVLLWNDDVHTMDYVVAVLTRTFGYRFPQALEIMYEAHETGKAVAWSGSKEVAEMYRDRLQSYGLTATVSK